MFSLCEAMKWAHLPEPGGLYNQHPALLDKFMYIFSERNTYELEKQEKERKEQKTEQAKSKRNPGGSRSPGRRR